MNYLSHPRDQTRRLAHISRCRPRELGDIEDTSRIYVYARYIIKFRINEEYAFPFRAKCSYKQEAILRLWKNETTFNTETSDLVVCVIFMLCGKTLHILIKTKINCKHW